jgi:hypothetical protein
MSGRVFRTMRPGDNCSHLVVFATHSMLGGAIKARAGALSLKTRSG